MMNVDALKVVYSAGVPVIVKRADIGGFIVIAQNPEKKLSEPLCTTRREVRTFKKLETLVSFLQEAGITKFQFDLSATEKAA